MRQITVMKNNAPASFFIYKTLSTAFHSIQLLQYPHNDQFIF
jgi:hypothetical protein